MLYKIVLYYITFEIIFSYLFLSPPIIKERNKNIHIIKRIVVGRVYVRLTFIISSKKVAVVHMALIANH